MPVVVSRARLFDVCLPLVEPFALSGGTMRERRSLIVELSDSAGHIGYGESAPFEAPFYSAETRASARACLIDWLLPRVLGRPIAGPAELTEVLSDGIRGNRMARAGVETAWWDLWAAREGVALAELVTRRLAELGVSGPWGERRARIACGVALGIPEGGDLDRLVAQVRTACARGYHRVKLKVRPGWDVEPIRAAREAIAAGGWSVPLTADANGAYHPERHAGDLERLDGLGLLYLEQPFPEDALADLAVLGRRLGTPVCLDESLTSDDVARQVLALAGPRLWNLKIQRVGGLEEACRIYARAAGVGAELWAGTMPETGLGAQAMLALAGHGGFVYPSDLEPSDRWFAPGTDLVALTMASDGTMAVPTARPALVVADRATLCWQAER